MRITTVGLDADDTPLAQREHPPADPGPVRALMADVAAADVLDERLAAGGARLYGYDEGSPCR